MKIKRLYIFLLKTYLPLFVMTFGICLFILLMQFLWKYVDEMVGKGIEVGVMLEVFVYAAQSFVPMALPLAILLASLMTFGNLGEQFELLAMKAAGISLLRIMKPLTVFLCAVAVGGFCFQNNIIPLSQVRMWTLLHSMRQKSPELDIPESSFCKEIAGYSIYVGKKKPGGLLHNLMIYDYSSGFNNAQVIVADSGRLTMATSKQYLILSLYSGEAFENLTNQGRRRSGKSNEAVPYRKESFRTKEILIRYDANFNRADESLMQGRYIGKNIALLRESIDSMTVRIDSLKEMHTDHLYNRSYKKSLYERRNQPSEDGKAEAAAELAKAAAATRRMNFDSLYQAKEAKVRLSLLTQARSAVESVQTEFAMPTRVIAVEEKEMRRHHTEMHKKFTLSFACLVFFFIGAPLGAIIRKGGLGMPVVISVLMFIFYYIIDNIGFKMASNGMWEPWAGMWLSSAVLLPLGIFLTWKAVNDSVILNADTYIDGFKKWMGIRTVRRIERKEIIMFGIDCAGFRSRAGELERACDGWLGAGLGSRSYRAFRESGGRDTEVERIAEKLEQLVEEGSNSDHNLVLNKLMDFPVVNTYRLVGRLSPQAGKWIGRLFPLGVPLYLAGLYRRRFLRQDLLQIRRVCAELQEIISKY
jgi:lipopolysaccharide export system permease protein